MDENGELTTNVLLHLNSKGQLVLNFNIRDLLYVSLPSAKPLGLSKTSPAGTRWKHLSKTAMCRLSPCMRETHNVDFTINSSLKYDSCVSSSILSLRKGLAVYPKDFPIHEVSLTL